MKGIKFLSVVLPWSLILLLLSFLLFLNPEQQGLTGYSKAGELVEAWMFLFRFADHWNVIALTFFLSVAIILLCINDLFIQRLVTKWMGEVTINFWIGGMRWLGKTGVNIILFLLELMMACYLVSASYSSSHIVEASQVNSGKHTVLLLGTSKYLKGTHQVNVYYAQRVQSCYQLYLQDRIGELIISGDGKSKSYDETADMLSDLRKLGVKGIPIHLDKSGYRTFDSIRKLKAKKGSGQTELLIVSQYFHLQRALYMARAEGIAARGVLAKGSLTWKMFERELLAKTKVVLDIYVFNTQTEGFYSRPRRLVNLSSYADMGLLLFVLSTVAIAGRFDQDTAGLLAA